VPSAHRVFVFGTLKEGFPNFHANAGIRVPGAFITCERFPFYLVGERFSPWLVDCAGEGKQVRGEVFLVDDATLKRMDELERVSEVDGYRRREIHVRSVTADDKFAAYAYLKEQQHLVGALVQRGPLAEYTLAHAARYSSRKL
jgi:gamma-glutamylaminecyclotransferase